MEAEASFVLVRMHLVNGQLITRQWCARVCRSHDLHAEVLYAQRTMVQKKNQNRDVCNRPIARPFICWLGTAHSFARSALLDSLARSVALIHSLGRSLTHFQACGNVNE